MLLDGITACTINMLDRIPRIVNLLVHFGMFVSYELYVTLLFWYWISVTVGIPKKKWIKLVYILPSVISICITTYCLPELEFVQGVHTNYSMGRAVYTCFISVAVSYTHLTLPTICSV